MARRRNNVEGSMIAVLPKVEHALHRGTPVVALESTLICHGFPYPEGLDVGLKLEATIRAAGAVPATVAVVSGDVLVGLDERTLKAPASRGDVVTPRVLSDLHRLSGGRTLRTNRALASNNAALAAQLAVALSRRAGEKT